MIITNTVILTNVVNMVQQTEHVAGYDWPLAFMVVGIMFGFAFIIKWS